MSDPERLRALLESQLPFSSAPVEVRDRIVAAAEITGYAAGELVLNAFVTPSRAVYVVLAGQVGSWLDARRLDSPPDEVFGPGGVFGFSAMLTERSIGPRVHALGPAAVARIPAAEATAAFVTPAGARFLAERMAAYPAAAAKAPEYATAGELADTDPLVVDPGLPAADIARQLSATGQPCAVVDLGSGRYALVTDASLRQRILVDGLPGSAPAREVVAPQSPVSRESDSGAEALIRVLESDADATVVVGADGQLTGVVTLREFTLSPVAADMALHQRLRRAPTVADVVPLANQAPKTLRRLLKRGLASGKVIAVHSSLIDTMIRRIIDLEFAASPELALDRFTWLALGSNGRREAVPSSDIDSAVAFADGMGEEEMDAYRAVFTRVDLDLAAAGLRGDAHGVSGRHELLSRTNAQWREAARGWLVDPVGDKGAIMTSLLVDARPLVGSVTTAAADLVLSDLREHPGTMRLLLEDALARRARLRSFRETAPWRSPARYNIKGAALLPLVNLARWGALMVHSPELGTIERLQAAGGTAFLPAEQAASLAEVFEVLQRLRLRYQLMQLRDGQPASDELVFEAMSPIDRSIVTQAVREIAAAQKRLTNFALYVDSSEWTARPQK
ncbi:MAG: putative nucleotidyltransferase substrate binding domain-containing protein [Tetrasphaera sp.]